MFWNPPRRKDKKKPLYRLIQEMESRIMARFVDADTKLNELVDASAKERAQVAAGLARIEELVAQVAAAQPEELQPLIDKMQGEIDALKADDPVETPVETPSA